MSVPPALIDTLLVALMLFMTYVVSSEGAWGAALMFFNVLFGGLIAFNFFEPLANLIDSTGIGWSFSETLAMMLIFCVSVLLLRLATETLAPVMVRFPNPVYQLTRLAFSFATTVVTFAIILVAFHAAPVHKKVFGYIEYNTKPPFGMGIDHAWLGFFQYTTGDIFATYGSGVRDPYSTYGKTGNQVVPVHLFDPRGKWLLDKQKARPYGEGEILDEGGGGEAAGGPEGPAGAGGGPGAPPGGMTSRPIGGPVAPAPPN
ncbi:CvpA family protein [Planctomyces sp. SH-PL62]|uniref:CvpA family protein n=1 Tax=Planctomyces sp. SH-PL62 TaxID=1636152 RepID=UPI00078DF912|nr:CvpA family protein [Planctomyces sp. SH-PL62]AMV37468.1 Colicin V production protein [Planctomyces sp. SH-PL62]